MTTTLMNFNKNSNIGLYAFVTNKFALVGREVHNKELKELRRVLEVPVHTISIAGTSLVGVFIAGNEDLVLVPSITFDHELEKLKKLKINFTVFESDFTCLGNNISLTKHGALVNPEFPDKEVKLLEKTLKVPVKKISIAETDTPGACIVVNKGMAVIHRDTGSKNNAIIEKTLKVKTYPGTINLGVPYIKSGIICNDKGLVIGDSSGPAEVMNCEEGLGFI